MAIFTAWLAPLRSSAAIDAPVSPNAQPGVAATLQFFDNLSGHYILAGQQEFPGWPDVLSDPSQDVDFNYIQQTTGRVPTLRGFDFLFYVHSPEGRATQHGTERAIAWAKGGGLVAFCCHMFMNIGSPAGNPQFYVPSANNGVCTTFDIRQAVIDGTPENTEFFAKLDIIAAELTKLRDAGVTVIWRPFHECSGGWFWWGAHGPDPLIQAWRIMFNRFTNVDGLNNLIWCYNPTDSTTDMQSWYPGDDFVDMISLDVYPPDGAHPTSSADYKNMRNFKNSRKVVVMSENGAIPNIDSMFAEGGGWTYFCTWNGFESDTAQNSAAFLNTVYNHDKVVTRDEFPAFYVSDTLAVTALPLNQAISVGASTTFTVAAPTSPTPTFQWQRNGTAVASATNPTLTLATIKPADTGLYNALATSGATTSASNTAILGISTTNAVVGAGSVVGTDILHPNGNHFDQVLVTGAGEAITTQGGRITRTSYIDDNDDIVQVEFSGAGTLSLVLDGATGPAQPVSYNQAINYMKGHAGIVITGANETTNVLVFTVGRATAFDITGTYNILLPPSATNVPANNGSPLFQGHADTVYDGVANIAFIAIASTDGKFGGVRAADANFSAAQGLTGIYAPGVQFTGPVYIGDVTASGTAIPVIVLGSATNNTWITGGDLTQTNGKPVQVSGLTQLKFMAGSNSGGTLLPAQTNRAILEQNGQDVTAQIVVNPTP